MKNDKILKDSGQIHFSKYSGNPLFTRQISKNNEDVCKVSGFGRQKLKTLFQKMEKAYRFKGFFQQSRKDFRENLQKSVEYSAVTTFPITNPILAREFAQLFCHFPLFPYTSAGVFVALGWNSPPHYAHHHARSYFDPSAYETIQDRRTNLVGYKLSKLQRQQDQVNITNGT